MKKLWISWMVIMLLSIGAVNTTFAHFDGEGMNEVKLTEDQKQELATISKSIMEQKKELISKYVEFGVITEEKGDEIISKFDTHYKKLEENSFVPKWDKCKAKERSKERKD